MAVHNSKRKCKIPFHFSFQAIGATLRTWSNRQLFVLTCLDGRLTGGEPPWHAVIDVGVEGHYHFPRRSCSLRVSIWIRSTRPQLVLDCLSSMGTSNADSNAVDVDDMQLFSSAAFSGLRSHPHCSSDWSRSDATVPIGKQSEGGGQYGQQSRVTKIRLQRGRQRTFPSATVPPYPVACAAHMIKDTTHSSIEPRDKTGKQSLNYSNHP